MRNVQTGIQEKQELNKVMEESRRHQSACSFQYAWNVQRSRRKEKDMTI